MSNISRSGTNPQRFGRFGSGKIRIRILKNVDPDVEDGDPHESGSGSRCKCIQKTGYPDLDLDKFYFKLQIKLKIYIKN